MTARAPVAWSGAAPEQLAERYYDATTWIYRWAWGRSFHFSPLRKHETRRAATRHYEQRLAEKLGLGPTTTCLDLGCGIGGPAATIATATRARIVAANHNRGQLRRLERSLATRARSIAGVGAEFACLPFRDGTFDRAYSFEALCHAVDLDVALAEVFRVLRPGGALGFSEWCLTDAFDGRDTRHLALRQTIEQSYGVVRLRSWPEWRGALLSAGFEIREASDQAAVAAGAEHDPWYRALLPRDRTFDSFARAPRMRALQAAALTVAERCGLAPRGTAVTIRQLRCGTEALVEAGTRGIFTPMMFVLAAKN